MGDRTLVVAIGGNSLIKDSKHQTVPDQIAALRAQKVAPDALLSMCERAQIPMFATHEPSAFVIDVLRAYLSKHFAERTSMHGVFMDILGLGVMITGESGLGKSELGLELISRGNGLVADDAVDLYRINQTTIEGRCPELLQNLLANALKFHPPDACPEVEVEAHRDGPWQEVIVRDHGIAERVAHIEPVERHHDGVPLRGRVGLHHDGTGALRVARPIAMRHHRCAVRRHAQ